MKIYLIAQKLSHSFSPLIHKRLADYSYELCELEKEELEPFFKKREFDGLNVTVPYKTAVMQYLDEISPEAEEIGAVNTVVNCGGRLFGYNTDYHGFLYTVRRSGIKISGKKVVIIGNGGASRPVRLACERLGAASTRIVTRAENTAEGIQKYLDGEIIINATPVGMYPATGVSPIKLENFKKCEAVFDLIYNPKNTKLILDSKRLGIPHVNGMPMLVSQAKEASEYFTEKKLDESVVEAIIKELNHLTTNIVLVGMPGAGKTVVGRKISKKLGREFFDCDELIAKKGKTPGEIISEEGEEAFRKIETEVLSEICKKSGVVIATGGGAVTVEENHDIINQNSFTVFINREISLLPTKGRPLSQGKGAIEALFKKRLPLYQSVCDIEIEAQDEIEKTADAVCKAFISE